MPSPAPESDESATAAEAILQKLWIEFGGEKKRSQITGAWVLDQLCLISMTMSGDFWVSPKEPGPYNADELTKHARVTLGMPVQKLTAANDNQPGFDIRDWPASGYDDHPAPIEYLVEGAIECGIPGMVAAMGDTGKSFLMLELCRRVAFGSGPLDPPIFGGRVKRQGTAVYLTAEDSRGTLHTRLAAMDAKGQRHDAGDKLLVIPLPDAGGARAFWQDGKTGMAGTDALRRFQDQLAAIDDLALVCIDPLASFAHAPVNEDPAAGAFVTASLAQIASETGASVLVAHHMRKPGAKPIDTLGDARDAIRGTTALVDGVRLAYALWPADEKRAKAVCRELGRPYAPGLVVLGGVVKANGPARRVVSTYYRNTFGLLIDVSADLAASAPRQDDILTEIAVAVAAAAASGQPFTRTGKNGLYDQRQRLPPGLSGISRARLEAAAQAAVDGGQVLACVAKGSKVPQWLDVPGGLFAAGLGQFRPGALQPTSS